MDTIEKFTGEYEFLSNFYPCRIVYLDKVWPSAEHLYQAIKTKDSLEREEIRIAKTPSFAKWLGKRCTLRSDWEYIKERVMVHVVKMKFSQNPYLIEKLVDTKGFYLKEDNIWHDNFFGDCICSKCKNKEGQNKLGLILMGIRRNYCNDNTGEFCG